MAAAQNPTPDQLQDENSQLRAQIIYLEEQLAWFKRQIFGRKSERILSNLNSEQLEGLRP